MRGDSWWIIRSLSVGDMGSVTIYVTDGKRGALPVTMATIESNLQKNVSFWGWEASLAVLTKLVLLSWFLDLQRQRILLLAQRFSRWHPCDYSILADFRNRPGKWLVFVLSGWTPDTEHVSNNKLMLYAHMTYNFLSCLMKFTKDFGAASNTGSKKNLSITLLVKKKQRITHGPLGECHNSSNCGITGSFIVVF